MHKDTLELKDDKIKELQDSVAEIEKRVDTSANRKQAAQSEAVFCFARGISEEKQKHAINFARQQFQEHKEDPLFLFLVTKKITDEFM